MSVSCTGVIKLFRSKSCERVAQDVVCASVKVGGEKIEEGVQKTVSPGRKLNGFSKNRKYTLTCIFAWLTMSEHGAPNDGVPADEVDHGKTSADENAQKNDAGIVRGSRNFAVDFFWFS